jgi:hypothetical protein
MRSARLPAIADEASMQADATASAGRIWHGALPLFGRPRGPALRQAAPMHRTILLQPEAPPKPAAGQPCNGCGVCCTLAPCPLGMLFSGRRQGRCSALRWHAGPAMYRCALLVEPDMLLPAAARPLAPMLAPLLASWARRWIAAGAGCDCDWEPGTHRAAHPPAADCGT